jgi:hypothetical protein
MHAEHHFAYYKLEAIELHTIAIITRLFRVVIA